MFWTNRLVPQLCDPGGLAEDKGIAAIPVRRRCRRTNPEQQPHIYNLSASALGVGTYRVDINIDGQVVGSGIFQVK